MVHPLVHHFLGCTIIFKLCLHQWCRNKTLFSQRMDNASQQVIICESYYILPCAFLNRL